MEHLSPLGCLLGGLAGGEGGLTNHPAASQAQWHTIVVGGHVFTHGNFTEGGVSPCDRINEQLGKWQGAVGDDNDWLNSKGIGPAGKANAEEELANAEGEVNRASGEAFEYGCDTVAAARSSKSRPVRVQIPSAHGYER